MTSSSRFSGAIAPVLTGYPLVPFLKGIVAPYWGDPAWRTLRPPPALAGE